MQTSLRRISIAYPEPLFSNVNSYKTHTYGLSIRTELTLCSLQSFKQLPNKSKKSFVRACNIRGREKSKVRWGVVRWSKTRRALWSGKPKWRTRFNRPDSLSHCQTLFIFHLGFLWTLQKTQTLIWNLLVCVLYNSFGEPTSYSAE